jgi:hypothetical protein
LLGDGRQQGSLQGCDVLLNHGDGQLLAGGGQGLSILGVHFPLGCAIGGMSGRRKAQEEAQQQ